MDEDAARAAFAQALATHEPGFGSFFLARLVGLEIRYEAEACIVELPVRDFLFNPQGSLHGGVIAFVMDVSMGHLINHSTGRPGITLEMKTQYLRPATGGRIAATGRYLRRGRTVSFLESRLVDAEGRLAAVATATWQQAPA